MIYEYIDQRTGLVKIIPLSLVEYVDITEKRIEIYTKNAPVNNYGEFDAILLPKDAEPSLREALAKFEKMKFEKGVWKP